ncbi:restriction endonuclease subunit S [Yersinia enterocolitica]
MVPKLRFRAFSEEYNIRKLKETADIVTGNTPSTSNRNFYGGEYMFVSPVDINEGKFVSHTKTTVSKEGFINGREIPAYSVMFVCIGSTIGKLAINSNPCITNQQINSLICNAYFSANYLYSILEKHSKKIKELAGMQAVPLINKTTFSNVELYFPNIEEQTKVASFISSVDEKISLMNKQYDLLCQYKKCIIQKIFSQEVRFKDDSGDEFPEWEEVELKKIASKVNTKNRDNSVTAVLTNSATQGIVSQESYFEREIVTESNLTGYYVVRIGDFVYNPRISSTAPVGPIKMNELTQGVMSPLYMVFRFEKGLLKFYQYFFESSVWHDYMKSVANSGARHDRMNISGADFFGLPVPQPFETEQTKIANFLSALDDKIAVKKAELDKLKTWKQGLLQQMFV